MPAHVLRRVGCDVDEAGTAGGAVRLLQDSEKVYDIVLTDVVLPDAPGPDAAAGARVLQPEAGVLFMSGYTPQELERYVPTGTRAFIEKPFTPDRLITAVHTALGEVAGR